MSGNSEVAYAYLNHGRWVAHCQTLNCNGAERLWPGGEIRHHPNSGKPYGISGDGEMICDNCERTTTVIFPDDKSDIDKVVAQRPVLETRNWVPGETSEDLVEENVAHGLDGS